MKERARKHPPDRTIRDREIVTQRIPRRRVPTVLAGAGAPIGPAACVPTAETRSASGYTGCSNRDGGQFADPIRYGRSTYLNRW